MPEDKVEEKEDTQDPKAGARQGQLNHTVAPLLPQSCVRPWQPLGSRESTGSNESGKMEISTHYLKNRPVVQNLASMIPLYSNV